MNRDLEITACRAYLFAASAAFRVGMNAQANENLGLFLEKFGELINHVVFDTPLDTILGILEEINAAQDRGDDLWVADLTEYELMPILK